MKRPAEEARRWLAQARHSLWVTRVLLENGLWSEACFKAEQTAQLALKAFLYARSRRAVLLQSVRELARECGKVDTDFLGHVAAGSTLDRYYLSSRYPDPLPSPAVPFEAFAEEDAAEAAGCALGIMELVSGKLQGSPRSAPARRRHRES